MQRFAALRSARRDLLHQQKVAAMQAYFAERRRRTPLGGVFLTGRVKRLMRRASRGLGMERPERPTGCSARLVGGRRSGGDRRLLIDAQRGGRGRAPPSLSELIEKRLLPLREGNEDAARGGGGVVAVDAWEIFLLNSCSRELRVASRAVGAGLATGRARSRCGRAPLDGAWQPTRTGSRTSSARRADADCRGVPFFLASPLEEAPASLGDRAAWQAE